MSEAKILRRAVFDSRVKSYWIWQPVLMLTLIIVTIPLAIIYAVVAQMLINRYLDSLSCVLTERTLDIKKGILNRTESTIPLDKITDLQLFQGPVMRYFGLYGFKVETAGQSSPQGGALVNLIGIIDAKSFRKAVLEQRDRLAAGVSGVTTPALTSPPVPGGGDEAVLTEIRDLLRRIETNTRRHSQ